MDGFREKNQKDYGQERAAPVAQKYIVGTPDADRHLLTEQMERAQEYRVCEYQSLHPCH